MTTHIKRNGYLLGPKAQLLFGSWSLFLIGGFSLALRLDPDPRGYGTHRRLGLPPCSFRSMFAVPCPSCGMTTSFSNFVRGRFVESVRANVAGSLLALACAVQIPWIWMSIYRGRLLWIDRPEMGLVWLLLIVCSVCLIQWAVRVYFG